MNAFEKPAPVINEISYMYSVKILSLTSLSNRYGSLVYKENNKEPFSIDTHPET